MKRTCTIAFNDSENTKIEFDQQSDQSTLAGLIDDVLDRNTLSIEVGGQLIVFPMANICSITVNPAPDQLPRSVIQGASIA